MLRLRAASELPQIDAVAGKYARRWAVVPLQAQEPIGVEQLASLVAHADHSTYK